MRVILPNQTHSEEAAQLFFCVKWSDVEAAENLSERQRSLEEHINFFAARNFFGNLAEGGTAGDFKKFLTVGQGQSIPGDLYIFRGLKEF